MNHRILRTASLISTLLIATAFTGCKKPGASGGGTSESFPVRVGEAGDAAAFVKVGSIGKNAGKRLAVDLERMPEHGSANLWACYQLPADSQPFGKAVCGADQSKNVELTAVNIDFTCEVNRDFGIVKARSPLNLDACESYDIFVYAFKPALEIRIVE